MNTTAERVYLDVPLADMGLFRSLIKKLGWKYDTRSDMLKRFVNSRPKNVDLADDDIMEELKAVRYNRNNF